MRRPARRGTPPTGGRPVLVTGFGPFPGVPVNPSGALALALGRRRRAAGPPVTVRVLATEWAGLAALDGLVRTAAPRAVLHIGVAPGSARPHLESRAYNDAAPLPDAAGKLAPNRRLVPAGPGIRRSAAPPLPSLREMGLRRSHDPGRYLCNATLYHSLAASRPWRPVAFLHIPPPGPRRGARPEDLAALAAAIIERLAAAGRPARPRRQSKSAPRAV